MHNVFIPLITGWESTGELRNDVYSFLVSNKCPGTAEHCLKVGEAARTLALECNEDGDWAEIAGWLHDVSAVYPPGERIAVAESIDIKVLPEERTFPLIIHQKISRVMAEEIFSIKNDSVLNAVECHTTLKANPSKLDLVLFVADKIEWDQQGIPPYIDHVRKGLEVSLEHAAFAYIDFLWQRRNTLRVVHPWLREAYWQIAEKLGIAQEP